MFQRPFKSHLVNLVIFVQIMIEIASLPLCETDDSYNIWSESGFDNTKSAKNYMKLNNRVVHNIIYKTYRQ